MAKFKVVEVATLQSSIYGKELWNMKVKTFRIDFMTGMMNN